MITRDRMLPLLVEACSSFLPTWGEMQAEEEPGERLPYADLGRFADHLVALQGQGRTEEFGAVFAVVERLHLEGDPYVQEAATIGLLEGIQNEAGHGDLNPEAFVPYLLPMSRGWWDRLNRFWSGGSARVGPSEDEGNVDEH